MRIVGNLVACLLILAGTAVAGHEFFTYKATGTYELLPLGQVWFDVHRGSLNLIQAVIERYVWEPLWDPGIATVLQYPASISLGLVGLVLLLLCLPRRKARKARKLD
jgi:hypothetical protein